MKFSRRLSQMNRRLSQIIAETIVVDLSYCIFYQEIFSAKISVKLRNSCEKFFFKLIDWPDRAFLRIFPLIFKSCRVFLILSEVEKSFFSRTSFRMARTRSMSPLTTSFWPSDDSSLNPRISKRKTRNMFFRSSRSGRLIVFLFFPDWIDDPYSFEEIRDHHGAVWKSSFIAW